MLATLNNTIKLPEVPKYMQGTSNSDNSSNSDNLNTIYISQKNNLEKKFQERVNIYNPSSTSSSNATIPTNNTQITNGSNYITLGSLSGTAPISYNSGTGAISITQSGTASNGYLSSTDWNTFNNKQSTLTNPVLASGAWTSGYLPKINGSYTITNSIAYDGGSSLGINTNDNVFKQSLVFTYYNLGGYIYGKSTTRTFS